MRLLDILNLTTAHLEKHGIASARLNAEKLISYVLGIERMQIYLQFDRPVSESEREKLRDVLRRRASGEPLQHITGTAEFFGRMFRCSPSALVPRPETEILIQAALTRLSNTADDQTLLDVGTGSGIVAITLLLERTGLRAIATDISEEALNLAKENAQSFGLSQRLTLVQADLFPENMRGDKFSIITANLPYLPSSLLISLPREVKFDPPVALDGGTDGLDQIRRVVAHASQWLLPGGYLILEFHPPQASEIYKMMEANGLREIQILNDLNNLARVAVAQLPSKQNQSPLP